MEKRDEADDDDNDDGRKERREDGNGDGGFCNWEKRTSTRRKWTKNQTERKKMIQIMALSWSFYNQIIKKYQL